jgi:hypothetical protein
MANAIFVIALAIGFALVLKWGFSALPGERWQIMAAVPQIKTADGRWTGINLTYYGFFNAMAYSAAVAMVFVLLGAIQVPKSAVFTAVMALLALCVPASRLVAKWVEKKSYTFTVAGASFIGIVAVPSVIALLNVTTGKAVLSSIPVLPALAALSIGYALGEGLGRFACVSFGCCYGKALADCHPILRQIFSGYSFTFWGKTKKVAYAGGLEGQKVFPIQAVTSCLYVAVGLVGILLFLTSHFLAAFLVPLLGTQSWRSISEILRVDYRGSGKVTRYQIMSIFSMLYALCMPLHLTTPAIPPPEILTGLRALWHPGIILFLQTLWVAVLFYTGRSMVTGSTLTFHVHEDRI